MSQHSIAFLEYKENWQSVFDFLDSAPRQEDQLASPQLQKLANTIYRSCVLLLSSYLEKFVETLVVESIDIINSANLVVSKIPSELRTTQIKDNIEALALETQNDRNFQNIQGILLKSQEILSDFEWFLDNNRIHNSLSGEPLISNNKFSNPSPDKIEELFKNLGIRSIIGKVVGVDTEPDKLNIRYKVKELIDKRNDIAHTGGTISVTEHDIKDYLNYSIRLVQGLEKIVSQELNKLKPNICNW